MDILGDPDIGLGCAEAFLAQGTFFERVLCDMQEMPFAAATFDAVVATATLHHSPRPERIFEEIARVLKPEGSLLAANEPLFVPWRETPEEEIKGAHEGAYTLWAWLRFLRQAGFRVDELKVGGDASLHFKASAGGCGGTDVKAMIEASIRYAAVLAFAIPRKAMVVLDRLKAGRPMRPAPRDPGYYFRARLGSAHIAAEALAAEETNWGPGWYPSEGGDEPFRWSGPRSRFLLPPPPEGVGLVLELASFHPSPQAHPVMVEVKIGGRKAGIVRLDRSGWGSFRLEVAPPQRRRPVAVALSVRSGYFVPRDMGLGEDRRLLGVACRGARWEAARPGHAPSQPQQ
jgi:hypothetical protein